MASARSGGAAAAMVALVALTGLSGCFLLAAAQPSPAPAPAPAPRPAAAAPAPTPAKPADPAPATAEATLPPEVDIAPPKPSMPDLRRSIGARSEGGTSPVAFQMLTRAMTP